jgi:hypothetical protein
MSLTEGTHAWILIQLLRKTVAHAMHVLDATQTEASGAAAFEGGLSSALPCAAV